MPESERSRWANRRAPDLDPWREQDACGVGFVARASGERSHDVMGLALQALSRVAHRGAAASDSSGDGAGVLTQIPARLFGRDPRSEEHTSELQSRLHLVCRLLLEKKKQQDV